MNQNLKVLLLTIAGLIAAIAVAITVYVNSFDTPPADDFTWAPAAPVVNEAVTFSVTAPREGVTYTWDQTADGVADGTGTTFQFTFQSPGTKETSLYADGVLAKTHNPVVTTGPVEPPPPPPPGPGGEYHVGPGQTYAKIGDVPWMTLQPGDSVQVHYRPEPYHEKILIACQGAEAARIRFVGLPGPNGEKPIIDATGATTSSQFAIGFRPIEDVYGPILVYHTVSDFNQYAKFVDIDGFDIRGPGTGGTTYTAFDGTTRTYLEHVSGIYLGHYEGIRILNCEVQNCANGIFGSGNQMNLNLLLEGNYFHGNGLANSSQCHNTYIECGGTVYRNNRYGRHRPLSGGGQLKDRGDTALVEGNRFEGGARCVDLGTAEASSAWMRDRPGYPNTTVRHNTFELLLGDGAQIMFVEGKTDTAGNTQRVEFTRNTVICYRNFGAPTGACTIAACWSEYTPKAIIVADHNLIWVSRVSDPGYANYCDWTSQGQRVECGPNILPTWWRPSYSPPSAEMVGVENLIPLGANETMPDPGFVDFANGDYRLLPTSQYFGFGAP